MNRIVLDTDIGTDVDDLWTLAMFPALRDELDLVGISVVYGDTSVRSRLAQHAGVLQDLPVPVWRGEDTPMSGKDIFWPGFEGEGVDGLAALEVGECDAVDHLVEPAATEPGTLDVVAIGPLTNIAAAVVRDRAFAGNLRHLTVMGGETASGAREHNFGADAIATWIVCHSGIPMTVMPLDQTMRVVLDRDDVTAIAQTHALGDLLLHQSEAFWNWLGPVLGLDDLSASPAHDPLALLTLIRPDLFEFRSARLEPDASGSLVCTNDDDASARIATIADPDAAKAVLMELLRS